MNRNTIYTNIIKFLALPNETHLIKLFLNQNKNKQIFITKYFKSFHTEQLNQKIYQSSKNRFKKAYIKDYETKHCFIEMVHKNKARLK